MRLVSSSSSCVLGQPFISFSVYQRQASSAFLATLQGVCPHFRTTPEALLLKVLQHRGETEA